MFKCTHCKATFEHKEGRKVLRENSVCPLCHDGVLRPVKCSCICHAVFDRDRDGEPTLCETCALCNPGGWRIPSIYPIEEEPNVRT